MNRAAVSMKMKHRVSLILAYLSHPYPSIHLAVGQKKNKKKCTALMFPRKQIKNARSCRLADVTSGTLLTGITPVLGNYIHTYFLTRWA